MPIGTHYDAKFALPMVRHMFEGRSRKLPHKSPGKIFEF
jgi:hypothetical protein